MTNLHQKDRSRIFAVLLVGATVSSLLQTSLTTALPSIMEEFSIDTASGQWLTNGFSLAMGIMIPITPFLIKRYKLRGLFLFSMILFSIGLIICGMAFSFEMLLFGRIIQAISTGVLLSLTQVVIFTIYPLEKRGTVMGIYGLAGTAAPVVAPTMSGIIVDTLNWNFIFWIVLVLAIIDILFSMKFLKNVTEIEDDKFDMLSAILSTLGLSALLMFASNLGQYSLLNANILIPIIIAIISLTLFSKRQLILEQPLLNIRVLTNSTFLFSVIIGMFMYAVMMAGSTLLPIYLQSLKGLSATQSGLTLMPGSLVMALLSPVSGKLFDKYGIEKLILFGSGLLAISCLLFGLFTVETNIVIVMILYTLRVIGLGVLMMPLLTWGMNALKKEDIPDGTAVVNSLRTFAGAIGAAMFIAVLNYSSRVQSNENLSMYGMTITFIVIGLVALLMFIIVLLNRNKYKEKR